MRVSASLNTPSAAPASEETTLEDRAYEQWLSTLPTFTKELLKMADPMLRAILEANAHIREQFDSEIKRLYEQILDPSERDEEIFYLVEDAMREAMHQGKEGPAPGELSEMIRNVARNTPDKSSSAEPKTNDKNSYDSIFKRDDHGTPIPLTEESLNTIEASEVYKGEFERALSGNQDFQVQFTEQALRDLKEELKMGGGDNFLKAFQMGLRRGSGAGLTILRRAEIKESPVSRSKGTSPLPVTPYELKPSGHSSHRWLLGRLPDGSFLVLKRLGKDDMNRISLEVDLSDYRKRQDSED